MNEDLYYCIENISFKYFADPVVVFSCLLPHFFEVTYTTSTKHSDYIYRFDVEGGDKDPNAVISIMEDLKERFNADFKVTVRSETTGEVFGEVWPKPYSIHKGRIETLTEMKQSLEKLLWNK